MDMIFRNGQIYVQTFKKIFTDMSTPQSKVTPRPRRKSNLARLLEPVAQRCYMLSPPTKCHANHSESVPNFIRLIVSRGYLHS